MPREFQTSTTDITTWPRAAQLAGALADLARENAGGSDTVDMLSRLAAQCVAVIPVSAAGILIVDQFSHLKVIGSSSDAAHLLDLYQVQNEEGPCLECLQTGVAIALDDLSNDEGRWPHFRTAAIREGFVSVYALPLRAQGVVLGALNLFADGPLDALALAGAQSLADAATLTLLRADPTQDAILVARRLHDAVETRNIVEQAKGMLAQRFNIAIDEAFQVLVNTAEQSSIGLSAISRHVTSRAHNTELDALLAQNSKKTAG